MPTNNKKTSPATPKAPQLNPDRRWSAEKLIAHGVMTVKELMTIETRRTELLRALAETLVLLRAKHGDIAGSSGEYRADAARIYEEAGVPADSQSGLQAAVRYHIGNVLREYYSEEDLAEAGLKSASPRERARAAQPANQSVLDVRDRPVKDVLLTVLAALGQMDLSTATAEDYTTFLELQVKVNQLVLDLYAQSQAA